VRERDHRQVSRPAVADAGKIPLAADAIGWKRGPSCDRQTRDGGTETVGRGEIVTLRKLAFGTAAPSAAPGIQTLLTVAALPVLARLLGPEEYLVALAMSRSSSSRWLSATPAWARRWCARRPKSRRLVSARSTGSYPPRPDERGAAAGGGAPVACLAASGAGPCLAGNAPSTVEIFISVSLCDSPPPSR